MTVRGRPTPRWWVLLLALAGTGVVALSWMAPEPQPQRSGPPANFHQVSYSRCAQDVAPNYGVRSISDIQCAR
ncbi:MAG: hypothetical protein WCH82_10050 [Mycobacteriaceae bacterium]